MGVEHERVARSLIASLEGEDLDKDKIDRAVNLFAENARFHTYAWEPPHVGHDAIRAELERQAPLYRDSSTEIVSIGSTDSTVFVERIDSMKIGGRPITMHVASVCEVSSDGRIASWRDYLDRKEIETKLAIDISTISNVHGMPASGSRRRRLSH